MVTGAGCVAGCAAAVVVAEEGEGVGVAGPAAIAGPALTSWAVGCIAMLRVGVCWPTIVAATVPPVTTTAAPATASPRRTVCWVRFMGGSFAWGGDPGWSLADNARSEPDPSVAHL